LVRHKKFWTGTVCNNLLFWHKLFGPAQNNLGLVEGQGINIKSSESDRKGLTLKINEMFTTWFHEKQNNNHVISRMFYSIKMSQVAFKVGF
jgi:hypothetical protein